MTFTEVETFVNDRLEYILANRGRFKRDPLVEDYAEKSDNKHAALVKKYREVDRVTVQRVRENPELMKIPRSTVEKWIQADIRKSQEGLPDPFHLLWKKILDTLPTQKVLEIMDSNDPIFEQLQHENPFSSILSWEEIEQIYQNGNTVAA